ncbi:hypothetical protein [Aneurinibacillus aneurinilyticus]|jgi:hypothetical protein|uniref:hypothetical protein n=1 Tax=Aneurinibacillus aneurinilyticus TaxID=1391 RepID=UPI0023F80331|nr:hypothetical protein [Aneurinibacillus aneurinilyticus]MCI1696472.1 hypothetical protein [Aneurinibacillus aneurinilyticus]
MNAERLAYKVRRIIQRHIRDKNYELAVLLETPAPDTKNRKTFSLEDEGTSTPPDKKEIKIVITAHSIDENATEIGDNPDEILEFISIEDGSEPEEKQVQEGMMLLYNGKKYNVQLVAPATLAGMLIIKECTARSVK